MFSVAVMYILHYAHAGVMARALILLVTPRTTRAFPIFVTSRQQKSKINREFSRVSFGQFFKNRLIS